MAQPVSNAAAADNFAARRLAEYINQERAAEGLPPVAISPQLTRVARAHVRDLMENRPDDAADRYGRRCTMHSWSQFGSWTPVCYTSDHAQATGMWNKPREITRGAYRDDGFEIAYWKQRGATAEAAIQGWLDSPAHEAVMLQRGAWRQTNWQAMGVAVYGDYAVAWFGKEHDAPRRSASR